MSNPVIPDNVILNLIQDLIRDLTSRIAGQARNDALIVIPNSFPVIAGLTRNLIALSTYSVTLDIYFLEPYGKNC